MKNIINRKILASCSKVKERDLTAYSLGGLMYTPAHNDKVAEFLTAKKYQHLRSLALCLEDAIADGSEEEAVKQLKTTFSELKKNVHDGRILKDDLPYIFIRVKYPEQISKVLEETDDDGILSGFIFPKFDMSNARAYLEEITKASERTGRVLYAMPIIESRAVSDLRSRVTTLLTLKDVIDSYRDIIVNIRIGGNDFCSRFGVRRSINDTIYDIAAVNAVISDIVNVFAEDYVISAPVWDYFEGSDRNDTSWAEGLRKEMHMDILNGLVGKTAIHPSQLPVIDELLAVSPEDYKDACELLNWKDTALAVAKGTAGNRMNELAVHRNWAGRILIRAAVYGIKETERITDIA
ncbi:HpcH/HpaI aldolase/citrate lyase family protein [Ruminococcus sp. HUN007]|uniref:HpcH/HpaI aldolase/citrate lyase family protein n=1 Tax=Ruminococcus sp. HUN007 TaxID=1514668 RepID=UPI0005D2A536|nr:HpcH/HpaI aldolase/citrate lyase family protein [Ruminococcus sp. HUN007]